MATVLTRALHRSSRTAASSLRLFHASTYIRNTSGGLTNILEGLPPSTLQVKTITSEGIQLADGLILPSACIFLDGKVFLWDVPEKQWEGWDKKHFEIFEIVVPKPEILLFGTGKKVSLVPPNLRQYLNQTGIQVDVMDTWNACSTYNLLTEEGRRVAAALLPLTLRTWRNTPTL
ncbi:hypothetical protein AcW2_006262 [Taiwanofungus camphoratus]|nr:hypothetical protein AcW2_006262 [Antrodia cinnamomea]